MIDRNHLEPHSICEIGCGAGEILRCLQRDMGKDVRLDGYEISPQAYQLAEPKANDRLRFHLKDILQEDPDVHFDLVLLIDLIEHLEDYGALVRKLKNRARFKMLHIPLDLTVQAAWRVKPLLQARKEIGHLHFFNRELALQALRDAGCAVLDSFYTPWGIDLAGGTAAGQALKLMRRCLYAANQDAAVRLLGGCSLMVLTD
jgi:SAM-dependent methyltransferase